MDPRDIGKVKIPTQVDPNSPYLKDFDQRSLSQLSKLYQEGKIGDEMDLVEGMAKLAHTVPSVRAALLPLIKEAKENWREELDHFRLASVNYPKVITAFRWQDMTCIEKFAVARKLAHQPLLKGLGLDKEKARSGEAFMVYKIDPTKNTSKFYEGIIIPGNDGFRVFRRWGALTDSGQTGRVDGGKFDHDERFVFPTMQQAKTELYSHYKTRVDHGYVDAFGPHHRSPAGDMLPVGQYPVGLTRKGPFGWGSQSVTHCIPALRDAEAALVAARGDVLDGKINTDGIKDVLGLALRYVDAVSHADSTMGQKIKALMGKPFRRVSGSPRFLPDLEGRALAAELGAVINFIAKQLSLCGR